MSVRLLRAFVACWLIAGSASTVGAANLLVNGDAETGDLSGWTDALGNGFDVFPGNAGTPTFAGQFSFWGGQFGAPGSRTNEIRQDVDVSSFSVEIDAGNATAAFSAAGRSNEDAGSTDRAEIRLEFFAGGGGLLATDASGVILPTSNWILVSRAPAIPAGTRTVRVRLIGTRDIGESTDAFFDDLVLSVSEDCALTPRGPLAWWRANGDATDSVGGNHGIRIGGSDYGPGVFYEAFELDGLNDHVEIGDVLDPGSGELTVMAWARVDGTLPATFHNIVRKGITINETANRPGFDLGLRADATLSAGVSDQSTSTVISVDSPAPFPLDDRFHHTALVVDRVDEELRLFLDGRRVATASIAGLGSLDTAVPLAIGALDRGPFGPDAGFFPGLIEDVILYHRALTDCEVAAFVAARAIGLCLGDADADSANDVLDNCPDTPNAAQVDADADGVGDLCDCLPADPAAHHAPGEIGGFVVGLAGDRDALTWCSAKPAAGSGTVHDLLRGAIHELPVGGGPSETCLQSGIDPAQSADLDLPLPGDGFYYLVRGANACATGTYGTDSASQQRNSAACP